MIDAPRLLREEEAAWRSIGEGFGLIPDARFEEPSLTPEGWSPKDAMFHVAGWTDDCARQLDRMRLSSFVAAEETRETIERQNRAWFEVSRRMDPAEVRSRFADSRRRMVDAFTALVVALGEATPEAAEWFEESGALHYAKHVDDLRSFVEAVSA